MILIPAHHIAILALLYAVEYFYRAWELRDRRYMYIGKALGRLIIALVYFWFVFAPVDADARAVWVRWSLFMFLAIDPLFVIQDHYTRFINAKHPG